MDHLCRHPFKFKTHTQTFMNNLKKKVTYIIYAGTHLNLKHTHTHSPFYGDTAENTINKN